MTQSQVRAACYLVDQSIGAAPVEFEIDTPTVTGNLYNLTTDEILKKLAKLDEVRKRPKKKR